MPAVTISNLSEHAHRALAARAARHNRSAEAEMRAILEAAAEPAPTTDWTRTEHGAVEGQVLALTRYDGAPALVLRARLSRREVVCVLDADVIALGQDYTWLDVWKGRRVLVSGRCQYDRAGDIALVHVAALQAVASTGEISVEDLRDPSFSDGLTPAEHVARVWGEA